MKCAERIGFVFAAVLFALTAGCAHTLGEPPTAYDLRNDGTPESQAHLYNEYKLTYADGNFSRPSHIEYSAEATSDAALNYLLVSEPAQDELATLPVAIDQFNHSPSFYATVVGTGVSVGAALGVFAALQAGAFDQLFLSAGGNAPDPVGGATTIASWTIYGIIWGLVASLPLALIADLTVKPMVRGVASSSYRNAAKAYNADLNRRIAEATDPSLRQPASDDGAPHVADDRDGTPEAQDAGGGSAERNDGKVAEPPQSDGDAVADDQDHPREETDGESADPRPDAPPEADGSNTTPGTDADIAEPPKADGAPSKAADAPQP